MLAIPAAHFTAIGIGNGYNIGSTCMKSICGTVWRIASIPLPRSAIAREIIPGSPVNVVAVDNSCTWICKGYLISTYEKYKYNYNRDCKGAIIPIVHADKAICLNNYCLCKRQRSLYCRINPAKYP